MGYARRPQILLGRQLARDLGSSAAGYRWSSLTGVPTSASPFPCVYRRRGTMLHQLRFEYEEGQWRIYLLGRDKPIGDIRQTLGRSWFGQMTLEDERLHSSLLPRRMSSIGSTVGSQPACPPTRSC